MEVGETIPRLEQRTDGADRDVNPGKPDRLSAVVVQKVSGRMKLSRRRLTHRFATTEADAVAFKLDVAPIRSAMRAILAARAFRRCRVALTTKTSQPAFTFAKPSPVMLTGSTGCGMPHCCTAATSTCYSRTGDTAAMP